MILFGKIQKKMKIMKTTMLIQIKIHNKAMNVFIYFYKYLYILNNNFTQILILI